MGLVTISVVESDLTDFQKALIIALISAIIGALGMIVSAIIQSKATDRMLELQQQQEQHLQDLKGAVGADKRKDDPKV